MSQARDNEDLIIELPAVDCMGVPLPSILVEAPAYKGIYSHLHGNGRKR